MRMAAPLPAPLAAQAGAVSDGAPGLEDAPAGTTRNSEHVKVYMFVRRERSRILHALFCRYWEEIHM